MDKKILNAVSEVVKWSANGVVIKATKFISPRLVVRAVRTRSRGKIVRGNIEITLTIGKPNYLEREFIKDCVRAKESFPVKRVQLKLNSKKK